MKFQCECGKEFDNPQAFNGHKSHCKQHYLSKYGNLDLYNVHLKNVTEKIKVTNANKKANIEKDKELRWVCENHYCERCGCLMTTKFGSGRFCSRACANSHVHSKESKEKCRNTMLSKCSKTKQLEMCIGDRTTKTNHFPLYKDTLIKKLEITDDYLLNTYSAYIKNHNNKVINQYCKSFNVSINEDVFIDNVSYNKFSSFDIYWLSVQNDLLVCENINFDKLREHHNDFVRPIPGFPYYYASKDGYVYKLDMTPVKPFNSNGYYQVLVLSEHNQRRVMCVHRLIALTFIPEFINVPDIIVHHIDEDKHNNRVDNLQVMTNSEHGRHHASTEFLTNYVKTHGPHNKGKKMSTEFCEKCKQSAIRRRRNK